MDRSVIPLPMIRSSIGSLMLSLCAASCQAGSSPPDDHVAMVKDVAGHVRVLHGQQWTELSAGALLFVADRIVSDAKSSAGIVFRDGTLLTVGPGSDTALNNYVFKPSDSKYLFEVYLAHGSAIYESGQIGRMSPQSVRVSTPTATVGVRGTRFIIRSDE
jgi:hypothetical protein